MSSSSFERILGIICTVFDAYTAVLFLPETPVGQSSTRVYKLDCVFSLGKKVRTESLVQEGQGLVGWIARHKTPLLVPNFDQRRNRLGYYHDNEEQNIKAFMGCALPDGKGIICVDSKRQYSFSDKDQKMLQLFAELVAQIYDDHCQESAQSDALRYYAALKFIYVLRREHSRWTEFLHSFLDIVSNASGYEYCALCTKQPDGEGYSIEGENYELLAQGGASPIYHINSGMVGWVFRNAAPLFSGGIDGAPEAPLVGRVGDTPAFQSLMALPLIIQRKVRGVLCLASVEPINLGIDVQDFVRMSSEHLALFLENLYVKCRLRDLHQITSEQKQ